MCGPPPGATVNPTTPSPAGSGGQERQTLGRKRHELPKQKLLKQPESSKSETDGEKVPERDELILYSSFLPTTESMLMKEEENNSP